jgi:hypothetical protein
VIENSKPGEQGLTPLQQQEEATESSKTRRNKADCLLQSSSRLRFCKRYREIYSNNNMPNE